MTTKWTKGWKFFPNGSGYDIRDYFGDVCTTCMHSNEKANAQLIVSAPDLYEALAELLDKDVNSSHEASCDCGLCEAVSAGDIALRAARGEQ